MAQNAVQDPAPDSNAEWLDTFEKLSVSEQETHVLALGLDDAAQLLVIAEYASDDWSAGCAIERLGELNAAMAIEPLCALLGRVEYDSERRESLLNVLSSFGPAILDPLLRMREELPDAWRRDDVVYAFCDVEGALPKDERIFAALCEFLPHHPDFGAELLEAYGDPRAIAALEQAIAAFKPNFDSLLSQREFESLAGAHYRLGGELPDDLHGRVHAYQHAWQERLAPRQPIRRAALKLGRNDPCSCGSGKKYKKCCLGSEATSG